MSITKFVHCNFKARKFRLGKCILVLTWCMHASQMNGQLRHYKKMTQQLAGEGWLFSYRNYGRHDS